ncbi:FHA domain-containing protein [Microlunatus flavus]|uniref:FHA domain-containing protein n=1 Tax=Microlunatus flavus TaxID=1036181 RepID=A0A1H9L4K2_9ACTN|nr:FHA domain-containing protein [Microlunatus flavus]SER05923.1 FHA domain-containing protein [Microlunatus flavus]
MTQLGRWRATYTPGPWLLLCGPAAAVVLEPADASWSDLVETLWGEVVAADSIGDLAARLAWYRIDTMPSFAAFFWGPDGMRSLVRGAVSVVDAESGDVVATGEGVQTWVETGLGTLRQVQVQLPTQRPEGSFPLPLVVGAVGVSSVFLDATDEAALTSPQSEPGPDAQRGEETDETEPETEPESETDATGGDATEGGGAGFVAGAGDEAPTAAYVPDLVPDDAPEQAADQPDLTSRTEHELADTRWVAVAELPLDDVPEAPASEPTVEAVFCPWGHPNPPGSGRCRVCTALVATQPPRRVPVPVLAVLRASNGETAEVVGSVLIGRAPARDRARVPDPGLLTVTSPSHDISRTHLEVFASGWDVGVTDLHSTNGTLLVLPDSSTRAMGSGETAVVELGTSVELADGVSVLIDFPQ